MRSLLAIPLILGLLAQGLDKPKATDAVARSKAMRAIVQEIKAEESGKPLAWGDEPVYRYDDPTRGWTDGTIWALGKDQGRPKALMTVTLGAPDSQGLRTWLYELTTLTEPGLTVVDGTNWTWRPQGEPPTFEALASDTAPDLDETKRLRQIKELSRRFKAYEYTGAPRYELRLLPQPIRRYSDPATGLLDGAIFVLAHGTNPEALVLIEARRDGKGTPTWVYAIARVSGAKMHVSIDDKERWTVPFQPTSIPSFPYANFYKRVNDLED